MPSKKALNAEQQQPVLSSISTSSPLQTFNQVRFHQDSRFPPKETAFPDLHALIRPHIESFNSIFTSTESQSASAIPLLELALQHLPPRQLVDSHGNVLKFWIEQVSVARPQLSEREKYSLNRQVMPRECRERGVTYKSRMSARIMYTVNGGALRQETKSLGHMPIMVKSTKCNLAHITDRNDMNQCTDSAMNFTTSLPGPVDLVKAGEDPDELGGYFIVNGIERIIRLLIVTRRNHPLALIRPSFAKRGPLYTRYGCMIRSVRDDQTSHTLYLQYCADGQCMIRFSFRKQEYLIPLLLILRALNDQATDREIMEALVQGEWKDTRITGRVETMLREFKKLGLYTQAQCLEYLGERFEVVLNAGVFVSAPPPKNEEDNTGVRTTTTSTSNHGLSFREIGEDLLDRICLVHLQSPLDKFNMLCLMTRKLFALVDGRCTPDNPDSPMHQELLLPGHLYLAYLKEKLDDLGGALIAIIGQDFRRGVAVDFSSTQDPFRKYLGKIPAELGKRLEYFLATGNLSTRTGLDLQQVSGYTVVAERLNFMRYLSHFRSVHRGSFFAELKTTLVRKLLPEAWGFLCPVHTPDGAPCGLLNHLAHKCHIVVTDEGEELIQNDDRRGVDNLDLLLGELGMMPVTTRAPAHTPVVINGRWAGVIPDARVDALAIQLRHLRAQGKVQSMCEIALLPPDTQAGLYPGLHLFSTPARFMRPVVYLPTDKEIFIGSLEQVFLHIALDPEDVDSNPPDNNITLHREVTPTHILSTIANLTPFSDFNQSPRNMYQCQMGKQSMGTPTHALPHRTDNKLYRLVTGQTPVVRTRLFDTYGFQGFPNGLNAIVAVISYTGYDMEDAMILNKNSYERGFAHATVYKSEFVDLLDYATGGREGGGKSSTPQISFGLPDKRLGGKTVDADGLPLVGVRVRPDDPLYGVVDHSTGVVRIERYKALEDAIVDQVRLIGDDCGEAPLQRLHIRYRIPRNPIIGDKFSSRHGQKGVCSQRWPAVDMPWSECGMQPDIIINPHAFPSRMTIGMFVESIAGKAGAIHAITQDATPFQFTEKIDDSDGLLQPTTAVEYFGEQLKAAGFNFYGNEPMWSGITGQELRADIYMGVVFYQRLRHMVSDKFQVRTTGPVHNLTQQPVKGRKRAGGIRFGEMERDSLLAHGVSFMLQDRLMNCSDYAQCVVCRRCGSILTPILQTKNSMSTISSGDSSSSLYMCHACGKGDGCTQIALPFVFRYLAAELMAMNIVLRLEVQ